MSLKKHSRVILLVALPILLMSCSNTDKTAIDPTATDVPVVNPTETPKPQPKVVVPDQKSQTSIGEDSFKIQPGTVARYKIGERLTRFKSPITAIGETEGVEGSIQIEDGKIGAGSIINVDLATLKSDENKRDGWVRRQGGIGKTAKILFKSVNGLQWPLPDSGSLTFDLSGDLTISGKTSETNWKVDAEIEGNEIKGKASTSITWEQFSLSKPRLPFIISVEDEIELEIDFIVMR